METLSIPEVRRAVLAAQGFIRRPVANPTSKHLRQIVAHTGLLQIDSVNILQRAHYMPVYSRLGPYSTAVLDRASSAKPRWLFEYWAHEASLVPVELHPLLRWRMDAGDRIWGGPKTAFSKRPDLAEWVLNEIAEKGPVTAAQIERDERPKTKNWGWSWSETKQILEALFYYGKVTSAGRTSQFARLYDLSERVIPAEIFNAPTPEPEDAHRQLIELAAQRLAVAAEIELRDYFRLPVAAARSAIHALADAGTLIPVQVAGWNAKAWIHKDATIPNRATASTLISPFDPLIWQRERTERLFGLNYRIEIYVPAAKRIHGYYVLPFLQGDKFTARVDLKADRQNSTLLIPAAWTEPGNAGPDTAQALAAELHRLAGWLNLDTITAAQHGDLAKKLNAAL